MVEKKKEKVEKKVPVAQMRIVKATFPIVGKTPLLSDKMPLATLKAIQEKQTGQTKSNKKQLRDIDLEIDSAIHYLPDGDVGFPAAGFKAGMIEATSFVGDKMFSKKLLKGLQITNAIDGLVQIKFKKQDVLKHNVGSNTKHTPQFHNWTCNLEIEYDENNVSAQDIAAVINYAGFYSGVGIWSPRCKSGGSYGMYELAKEIK